MRSTCTPIGRRERPVYGAGIYSTRTILATTAVVVAVVKVFKDNMIATITSVRRTAILECLIINLGLGRIRS